MVEVFLDASEKNVCIPKFMAIAKSITEKYPASSESPNRWRWKDGQWILHLPDTTLSSVKLRRETPAGTKEARQTQSKNRRKLAASVVLTGSLLSYQTGETRDSLHEKKEELKKLFTQEGKKGCDRGS